MYDMILVQKPVPNGLKPRDFGLFVLHFDQEKEYFPVEIPSSDLNSSAMGVITSEASECFDYENEGDVFNYIADLLSDFDKQNDDGIYVFKSEKREKPIRILLK